jgi:hypothetical protein
VPDPAATKPVVPVQDPRAAALRVRDVFKRISQEVDVEKYGLSGLIVAIQKALGIDNEELLPEDQKALVEFVGADAAATFIMLVEDVPAMSSRRATVLVNWFDMFMRAVRENAEPPVVWRLARKTGLEFINALADRTIRS